MKSTIKIIIPLLLIFFSCKSKQPQEKKVAADPVNNKVEIPAWTGVYTGSFPCGDCAGIFTRVDLKNMNEFHMEWIYLGKSPDVNSTDGKITWIKDKNILKLESQPPMYFSVYEKSITKLNDDQQPYASADSARYTLNKQDPIAERTWRPVWLEQTEKSPAEHFNDIRLTLSTSEKRAFGKGGCNTYSCSFERSEPNGIKFYGIISTKMACPALLAETDYFKALGNARSFEVYDNVLTLFNEQKNPVAKFEIVITK